MNRLFISSERFGFVSEVGGMSFKVCLLNITYNIVRYKIVAVSTIIGGQPAEQYPFFVSVYTENQLGGGTIVFDDIVVTAAHRPYDSHEQRWVYPEEIEIFHGDFIKVNDGNLAIYPCVDYITHFKFKPISHGCKSPYNVAVTNLEKNLNIMSDKR